jgi:hypothetical protein
VSPASDKHGRTGSSRRLRHSDPSGGPSLLGPFVDGNGSSPSHQSLHAAVIFAYSFSEIIPCPNRKSRATLVPRHPEYGVQV